MFNVLLLCSTKYQQSQGVAFYLRLSAVGSV